MLFHQKSFCNQKPTLYLVATPIGNLEDITFRAVRVLKEVFLILAEDTRNSKKLLEHYQIKKKIISYYQHNQKNRLPQILELLSQGKDLALISDAGTPLISDPGFLLVNEIEKKGFNIVAIPGASAFLTAFVTANLKTPFIFLGFLPRLGQALKKELLKYQNNHETLIIYESPYRIKKTLLLIHQLYGNRRISLARELTKKFETIINGNLEDVLKEDLVYKGEYVLLIEGKQKTTPQLTFLNISEHIAFYLKLGFSQKEALMQVAQERQESKKEIYRKYNHIKNLQDKKL
ncbi:Putative methyltransferase [Candidatus Phytoplasma australiense]|uniref:Ribosomal RNA small subunit methyltransferase I n=2 Tax=Phytoplasma australiense TaxID=59748 RepID=B1V970_PHYAS|nr:16S rRNA (cytidine(1402)-2'-O)-methyltransferase [Candidatus Phytoplasma australiense]AGL90831.1 Tetrapyrrole Methylase Family Protein [Strawberry lethal yellows phytoplasma (CPA) str. NZSb11]CAM11502.1 Putative methyltransferase [Candidatus Phytoplasma australiense]